MTDKEIKKQKIQPREITQELQESYLDYAMSVIVTRALPDVRDGLKPVQRRILWAMHNMGLGHSNKFIKSARVIGETLGKFHPHGDMAVYDALVRMAQDFSLRYTLIEGQGNFGSIDGDSAAAQRYTECRLSRIAEKMLVDIEKDTVDWQPTYDNSRKEPKFLPARVPNLLLNGAIGIAVGMATSIPPHNLQELVAALIYLIEHPEAETKDLTKFVLGPDFPTGGIIYNPASIEQVYITGRGPITTRGVIDIQQTKNKKYQIIITEIPYQVNKAELIKKIAKLIQEKRLDGIRDIRDESDRDGLRIVIELRSNAVPQKIVNQLYKFTELQKNFYVNMLALVDGIQPQVLSLKDILQAYLDHRKIVVRRRTEFNLKKAEERAHILTGLAKALKVIDKIIATIKKSKDREAAHQNLIKKFELTSIQAIAILEMKLQTLAALERKKIEDELKEKKIIITELKLILKQPKMILDIIIKELLEVKKDFPSPRKTKIAIKDIQEFQEEDLIPQEDIIITLSRDGYIKRMIATSFKAQKRGGKGIIGFELKEEDFIYQFISANTHDNILFFTDRGRVFKTKAYELPAASRTAKGKTIYSFLQIPDNEQVSAIIAYASSSKNKSDSENKYLVMLTKNGIIKKTPLKDFDNIRRSGLFALKLKTDDRLKWAGLSSGNDEIIITTTLGKAIRFKEKDVRPMGRTANGLKAIKLKNGDLVAGLGIIKKDSEFKIQDLRLLVIMANGFGKQTLLKEFKLQRRGGQGIKAAKITEKNGPVIAAQIVTPETEEILAFSSKGQVLRTKLSNIRTAGRATQGVKIMNLNKEDKLVGIVSL